MRICIISWNFPPSNTIAALRVGFTARFLLERGHDIRVITGKDPPYPQTLQAALPTDRIHITKWVAINAFPTQFLKIVCKPLSLRQTRIKAQRSETNSQAQTAAGAQPTKAQGSDSESSFSRLYRDLTNIPDKWIGWLPFAVCKGLRIAKVWKPDIVFASAPPHTTLLIGAAIAHLTKTPFVVEFRDRWSDDPYYLKPGWRLRLERHLESRIVRQAASIVTVSEPWAKSYRQKYSKPVCCVYNGFDPGKMIDEEPVGAAETEALVIRYFGGIYPGRRDPSPLFQALCESETLDCDIRVEFFGSQEQHVLPLAAQCGVSDRVTVHPPVPHDESLRLQRRADILLIMQWNDPREQGNVPGKLFEYLAARRPILGLGLADGVPARLITDRGAGVYANAPRDISAQLRRWNDTKRELGHIPALPTTVCAGVSRSEQCEKLETFLTDIVR